MKKIILLLMSVLCLMFIVGCGEPPEPPMTYHVTFKQAGQEDIVKEVLEGEILTDVPTPAPKEGYNVVWEIEDFSSLAITQDMTVNAVETAKVFTVHYDENGGVEIDKTTEVTFGEVFSLENTTREGYLFAGYEINGQKITSPMWVFDSDDTDVTVKVLWNYQIVFRQTGYEDVVVTLSENQRLEDAQIPTPNPRTGYTVLWGIQDYSDVCSYTVVTVTETPNKYKIFYDQITDKHIPEGVDVLFLEEEGQIKYYYEITYNSSFDKNLLLNPLHLDQEMNLDRTMIFDYWQGIEIIDGVTWNIAEDVTVSAVYRNNTYTWYFMINNKVEMSTNVVLGESLSRTFPMIPKLPQKDGYIAEWDTNFWEMTSGGGTIRPRYFPIEYKLIFDLQQGESAEYTQMTFIYGQPYSINNPATHTDGRVFFGWEYNGAEFTNQGETWTMLPPEGTVLVDPVTYERLPVEIRLTPIWKYRVTFKTSDGNVDKYVTPNEILTDVLPVYEDGVYRYVWDYDFTKPITQNIETQIVEKVIRVTLNLDGGMSKTTYIEVRYGREYSLPFVKFKNFEFDGYWTYKNENAETVVIFGEGIWNIDVDSITLTAKKGAYISGNY